MDTMVTVVTVDSIVYRIFCNTTFIFASYKRWL